MAAVLSLRHTNEPRASQARAALELANVAGAYALNRTFANAGIAIGTTTTKVKTANTTPFTVSGTWFSKAATDDFWTLSGTVVAASSWQKYALLMDNTGAASIREATQSLVSAAAVSWTNISALGSWAPLLTILNAGTVIVGYLTVATDATHTFTPGTTALGAAGITTTYSNGIDQYLMRLVGNETGLLVGLGG